MKKKKTFRVPGLLVSQERGSAAAHCVPRCPPGADLQQLIAPPDLQLFTRWVRGGSRGTPSLHQIPPDPTPCRTLLFLLQLNTSTENPAGVAQGGSRTDVVRTDLGTGKSDPQKLNLSGRTFPVEVSGRTRKGRNSAVKNMGQAQESRLETD